MCLSLQENWMGDQPLAIHLVVFQSIHSWMLKGTDEHLENDEQLDL